MEIDYHGWQAKLPDEWWLAAGMLNFRPTSSSYRCEYSVVADRRVCQIPIREIEPVHRAPGVPIFNDNIWEGVSVRERVERILRGFAMNDALPPVELAKQTGRHPFCLKNGLHRVYCSIAAGFRDIPAVRYIDLAALDAGEEREELC